MRDILRDIYTHRYEAQPGRQRECNEKQAEAEAPWEALEQRIGSEQREKLQAMEDGISFESNFGWFREGFQLGALLMLELL